MKIPWNRPYVMTPWNALLSDLCRLSYTAILSYYKQKRVHIVVSAFSRRLRAVNPFPTILCMFINRCYYRNYHNAYRIRGYMQISQNCFDTGNRLVSKRSYDKTLFATVAFRWLIISSRVTILFTTIVVYLKKVIQQHSIILHFYSILNNVNQYSYRIKPGFFSTFKNTIL